MTDDDYTPSDSVVWLRAKFARHGELEDKLAADEIERLREHQRRAMHDPDVCNGRMVGEPPRYTPMCVSLRAAMQRMAACENIYTARAIASVALHGVQDERPNV
jgi:hypothetical protein